MGLKTDKQDLAGTHILLLFEISVCEAERIQSVSPTQVNETGLWQRKRREERSENSTLTLAYNR